MADAIDPLVKQKRRPEAVKAWMAARKDEDRAKALQDFPELTEIYALAREFSLKPATSDKPAETPTPPPTLEAK